MGKGAFAVYQVLYRKYRPQVFSDVVGQEHITTTLASEIESGKLSHAYLFTGSRGTGKTTCAKILAKAVNCLSPKDGNPCGECEICRGIDSGAILDVVEIDAASNNGVDNIRDIREESSFAPVACKFRVYIIDEVHMLSIGAFNALLKTLEEPPPHVKFILATTEVHKLPVTILSRCQRFDFKRVAPQAMIGRMQFIAAQEGFTLDDDAAVLIARLADGGMRDALSTLDQCIGQSSHVTAALVTQVAGMTGRDHLFALSDAVASGDAAGAMELLDRLYAASCDMERLCADLTLHFRNLMIVKTVKAAADVLVCTAQELEDYRAQSKRYTLETILSCIDALQTAGANIKKGVNRRVELEMTLLRLTAPAVGDDLSALRRRVAALEQSLQNGVSAHAVSAPAPAAPQKPTAPSPTPPVQPQPVPDVTEPTADAQDEPAPSPKAQQSAPPQTPPTEEAAQEDRMFDRWPQVLGVLAELNKPLWGVLMNSTAVLHGDFVLLQSDNPALPVFIKSGSHARDIREAVQRVTGKKYRLGIFSQPKQAEAPQEQTPKQSPLDAILQKAKDGGVKVNEE